MSGDISGSSLFPAFPLGTASFSATADSLISDALLCSGIHDKASLAALKNLDRDINLPSSLSCTVATHSKNRSNQAPDMNCGESLNERINANLSTCWPSVIQQLTEEATKYGMVDAIYKSSSIDTKVKIITESEWLKARVLHYIQSFKCSYATLASKMNNHQQGSSDSKDSDKKSQPSSNLNGNKQNIKNGSSELSQTNIVPNPPSIDHPSYTALPIPTHTPQEIDEIVEAARKVTESISSGLDYFSSGRGVNGNGGGGNGHSHGSNVINGCSSSSATLSASCIKCRILNPGSEFYKSGVIASRLRDEGNARFKERNDIASLLFYTESVIMAPVNSPELPLAFANRSAVLYHMKKYDLCIQDIDLAFRYHYPDYLEYKIHQRKGQCLLALGQYAAAESSLRSGIASVQAVFRTSEEKREALLKDCYSLLNDIARVVNGGVNKTSNYDSTASNLESNEPNHESTNPSDLSTSNHTPQEHQSSVSNTESVVDIVEEDENTDGDKTITNSNVEETVCESNENCGTSGEESPKSCYNSSANNTDVLLNYFPQNGYHPIFDELVNSSIVSTENFPDASAAYIELRNSANDPSVQSAVNGGVMKDCGTNGVQSSAPPRKGVKSTSKCKGGGTTTTTTTVMPESSFLENDRGRYVVAKNNISVGEILFQEHPFASVLLAENYSTHCHHCYQEVLAPIPCLWCTQAIYCTDKCRKRSWHSYHEFECRRLDILNSIGIGHLAERIALVAGAETLIAYRPFVSESSTCEGGGGACKTLEQLSHNLRTERDRYAQLLQLVHHQDKLSGEDLFQYALTATLITLYLEQETPFFNYHFLPSNFMPPNVSSSTNVENIKNLSNKGQQQMVNGKGGGVGVGGNTNVNGKKENKKGNNKKSKQQNPNVCNVNATNTSAPNPGEVSYFKPRLDQSTFNYFTSLFMRHILQLVCNASAICFVGPDRGLSGGGGMGVSMSPIELTSSSLSSSSSSSTALVNGGVSNNVESSSCHFHQSPSLPKKYVSVPSETTQQKVNSNSVVQQQPLVTIRQHRIATAIYSSASMMNHSCNPNVTNTFYKDVLIVRALRPMRKGEEVLNSYGPRFGRHPFSQRRFDLMLQYQFECTCVYCTSKADFEQRFFAFKCRHCKDGAVASIGGSSNGGSGGSGADFLLNGGNVNDLPFIPTDYSTSNVKSSGNKRIEENELLLSQTMNGVSMGSIAVCLDCGKEQDDEIAEIIGGSNALKCEDQQTLSSIINNINVSNNTNINVKNKNKKQTNSKSHQKITEIVDPPKDGVKNNSPTSSTSSSSSSSCNSSTNTDIGQLMLAAGLYNTAMDLIDHMDYYNAIDILKSCLELKERALYKYNFEVVELQVLLAKCFVNIGDYLNSLTYLKATLKSVQMRFGPRSIEYGYELLKLIDILSAVDGLEGELLLYVSSSIDQAYQILELHNGPWHETSRELAVTRKAFRMKYNIQSSNSTNSDTLAT